MCGLVGLVARRPVGFNSRELDLFEQMLAIDTIRGKDSTGVMAAFRDKDVRVVKVAEEPYLLYRSTQWMAMRGKTISDGRFIMGHNRAATRGSVSNENAHPFVENHIILMHNGTLRGHTNLTDENVEVDSHAICHALAGGTPQEVIPKIKGAFALIWYNTETERLYATRNDERPLCILETDDLYLLASEPWIAACPAGRQGRTIKNMDSVDPYKLYEWDLKGNLTTTQLEEPKPEPVVTTVYQSGYSRGRYDGMYQDDEEYVAPFTPGEATPQKQTPQEIENLRKALTHQAQEKDKRTPTNDCALTQPKDTESNSQSKDNPSTTTTESEKNANTVDTTTGPSPTTLAIDEERVEVQQREITVFNENFKRGEELLVKIWQIVRQPNGRIKFTGKVMQPGKEMIDCQGFLPKYLEPYNMAPKMAEWMKETIQAKVGWYTHTTCGPTVFVTGAALVDEIDVHAGDIPKPLWDHVVAKCECGECGTEIQEWEHAHTHVKTKSAVGVKGHAHPLNQVTATCAECLMRIIPEGDFYDKFVDTYYAAKHTVGKHYPAKAHRPHSLQDRESVSEQPSGKDDRTPAIQGSPTVQ